MSDTASNSHNELIINMYILTLLIIVQISTSSMRIIMEDVTFEYRVHHKADFRLSKRSIWQKHCVWP